MCLSVWMNQSPHICTTDRRAARTCVRKVQLIRKGLCMGRGRAQVAGSLPLSGARSQGSHLAEAYYVNLQRDGFESERFQNDYTRSTRSGPRQAKHSVSNWLPALDHSHTGRVDLRFLLYYAAIGRSRGRMSWGWSRGRWAA